MNEGMNEFLAKKCVKKVERCNNCNIFLQRQQVLKMTNNPGLDIDSLRQEHENPTEWRLRKVFLKAHQHKLPLDRLVCMSNCFINTEMHGCRYPGPVMESLRELMEEIKHELEIYRIKVKTRTEVKFVKASNPDTSGKGKPAQKGPYGMAFVKASAGLGQDSKAEPLASTSKAFKEHPTFVKPNTVSETSARKSMANMFVKSKEEFHSTDISKGSKVSKRHAEAMTCSEDADQLFYQLGSSVRDLLVTDGTKNAVEIFYMAASKSKVNVAVDFATTMERQHMCKVYISFIQIAKAEGQNRKAAKHTAFEEALGKLCKSHLRIVHLNSDQKILEASDEPFAIAATKPLHPPLEKKQKYTQAAQISVYAGSDNFVGKPTTQYGGVQKKRAPKRANVCHLGHFYLYEPQVKHNGCNAAMILRMSTDFSRTTLDYQVGTARNNEPQCTVLISGQPVATLPGVGLAVKNDVSEKALNLLRHSYYTIQIKPKDHDSSDRVTKEEISGDNPNNEAIPETNIGNKLLKMMGWEGGGVGKSGQGIAEPVNVESVINREGLGLRESQGITKEFRKTISNLLHEYAVSNDEKDLVFSPDFSKEERVIIHKEAQKLKLKSKSHNQYKADKERYLVISRKRSSQQLVEQLLNAGGEIDTHKLVEPGQHEELDG